MLFKLKVAMAFIGVELLSTKAGAALLTDNAFSFGKIAITKNASVSTVQMSRSGRAATTGNIYILEIGQPGGYTLTELPPFAIVSMSAVLPAFSFSTIPGTQQFTVSALDIPSTLNADASGNAQFKVGGVLQTSGLGGRYIGPAEYQIFLDIDISY
jgi:hypothetical protein